MCVSEEEVLDMEDWKFEETAAKLREELDARLEALKASNEDWNAGMAAIQAHLDEGIAKLRKECETRLEAPASSTIAAAPTKISEAAPSNGGTAVPVLSVARAARAPGSADDRLVPGSSSGSSSSRSSNDNARKDNSDNKSSRSSNDNARKDNSDNSRSRSSNDNARKDNSDNNSSRSSNDNARKDNSWRDATCTGKLLRPFDPGKRCLRRMRRGIAVLGVALPFDRGKEWGGKSSMEGDGLCAEGCAGGEHLITRSASRFWLFA